MRLVDIFFKNIEGQASDIKGNINNIGHLVLIPISKTKLNLLEGYFEVDGSRIASAKVNYPKLYLLLSSGAGEQVAKIDGNDIVLGRSDGVFRTNSTGYYSTGLYYEKYAPVHHHYNGGDGGITTSSPTTDHPSMYAVRFFIYHGVH